MSFITIGGAGNNNSATPTSLQGIAAALIWKFITIGSFLALVGGLYYTWTSRIEDKALAEERHAQVTKNLNEKEKQIKRLEESQGYTRAAMENIAKGSEVIRKQTAKKVLETETKVQAVVDDPTKTDEEKDRAISMIYGHALREQQCQANPLICKEPTAASRFFNLQNFNFLKGKP